MAGLRQGLAQRRRQLVEMGDDAVMGDERLGKDAPHNKVRRRKESVVRLMPRPQRLIETAQDAFRGRFRMEAPLKARARQRIKLADAFETEPPQQMHGVRLQTQRLDGKGGKRAVERFIGHSAFGCDGGCLFREAGQRVRGAQRLGGSKPRSQAKAREPRCEIGKERVFAAEEMRDTGNVEPQLVIAVHVEGRAVARGPAGERQQHLGIVVRCGGGGEKLRADGAGIGKPEAG